MASEMILADLPSLFCLCNEKTGGDRRQTQSGPAAFLRSETGLVPDMVGLPGYTGEEH